MAPRCCCGRVSNESSAAKARCSSAALTTPSMPTFNGGNSLYCQRFVFGKADGSASGGSHRAMLPQVASGADFRVKLHGHARREALGLACRAGDSESPHVDVEVVLGEQPGASVAGNPRLAEYIAAFGQHAVDGCRIDVAAV